MAVVYFTSNASTGAGSLAEAVANAAAGDIIRPDETVFERGSIIEIALARTLTLDKNLTLDASPFRVRLDVGGSGRVVAITAAIEVAFIGYDFIGAATTSNGGFYATSLATVTLRRCGFYGCSAANGGGVYASGVSRVYDCVFVGCRATESGGGISVAKDAVLNGVTVAGCVAATGGGAMRVASGTCVVENSILAGSIAGAYNSTATGSVVDVASSQVGFVAPPPDDLTSDTWDANAWQNWDLRLLDDASANPSPYRDSGDIDSMSQYDYQGNFRGRETNGAASCSSGAYETIQADLFWVGRDATGAEVVAPSWNASSGWAASRFAIASGDKAPQSSDAVFVDGAPTFDVSSFRVSRLVVGGGTSLGVKNTGAGTLSLVAGVFDFGYGSTVRNAAGTSRLQIQGSAASRFADYVYFPQHFYFGDADALQIAPTAKFTTVVSAVKLYANGTYNNYNLQISEIATVENGSTGCNNIYVNFQKPTARIAATGSPRAVCNTVKWTTPTGATDDFTGLSDGSTPIIFAPKKSATVAGAGSANDFIVDISQTPVSQTLALTLTGQAVYGSGFHSDGNSYLELSGRAKIGRFLQAALKIPNEATLAGGGGVVNIGYLALSAGATFNVVSLDFTITSISLPENATLTIDGGAISASFLTLKNGARVVIVGAEKDAVFSALDGDVTAQDATINGDGLSTSSLSISSGAALTVDGGNVDVTGTLTVNADSKLTVVGARVSAADLSVYSGAEVAFSPVEANDAILAVRDSATVYSAIFSGVGYFASPPGTDLTASTVADTVRSCDYGANVSSFEASANSTHSALLSWVKQKTEPAVLIEKADGVSWSVVNNRVSGTSLIVDISEQETFRLFDGENFFTASARPYGAAYELAEVQTIGYLKTMISTGYLN